MDSSIVQSAVTMLRGLLENRTGGRIEEYKRIVAVRDEVLARFRPMFEPAALPRLTEQGFRDFLLFKNNRHWMSLERHGSVVCADMSRLRKALAILLDESRPIENRLTELVPVRGPKFIPRLGKSILTPILLIHDPSKYGVWNSVSETGMRRLGVWPELEKNLGFGRRYKAMNDVLVELAQGLQIDQWFLDAMWWAVLPKESGDEEVVSEEEVEAVPGPGTVTLGTVPARFGLERHLHEFLRDNWDHLELGRSWKLHEEDGDADAGYEYPTDIGRIDLLARHRSDPRWLVIELKRQQSSDQTVGQVLRYMGWVKKNLAKEGDKVEGLIVAHDRDDSVKYALDVTEGVSLKLYEVQFRLHDPDKERAD